MTLLLTMLLACGDKEQADDSAVEEAQQEETEDTSKKNLKILPQKNPKKK